MGSEIKLLMHRYLDPSETLSEILFGLIMVLTITTGARIVATEETLDTQQLVIAAVGCNLAWGIIDAVLYVLGALLSQHRRVRLFRRLKAARSEVAALAAIQEEFALEEEPLAASPEDRARFYRSILALTAHATPTRAHLRRNDIIAALIVFGLVSATALPGVLPFLVLRSPYLALRVSNAMLVVLLFLVGFLSARYADVNPWKVGLTVLFLGLSMVAVAIALGG